MAVEDVNASDYKFEIGKGVLLSEGKDVSIVATGIMVEAAHKAKDMFKEEGIEAEVINIRTLRPIDSELFVKTAKKTKAVVTAEEHSIIGGLGSAVAEVLSEECPVPVLRVGIKDVFGESGKPSQLLEKYGLTQKDIVEKAKKAISLK